MGLRDKIFHCPSFRSSLRVLQKVWQGCSVYFPQLWALEQNIEILQLEAIVRSYIFVGFTGMSIVFDVLYCDQIFIFILFLW